MSGYVQYIPAPTSVAVVAPIINIGTPTAPTIGISAATTGAAGSMSAADKTKLDNYGNARNMLTLGGNVALNNVGYTTILSGTVVGGGNQTIRAEVTCQQTPAGVAQTVRMRIRVNGVDIGGSYDYVVASGFVVVPVTVQAVLFNGDTVSVVGLVGTGNVSALQDMPDGVGVRATRLMWGV